MNENSVTYNKNIVLEKNVTDQLKKIKAGNPKIKLIKPCRIGDGIITINDHEAKQLLDLFEQEKENKTISFFIPASGSGSRMFNALFDYVNSTENIDQETYKFIEKLLTRINEFAFYNKLPRSLKIDIKSGDVNIKQLINFIINEEGLNLGFSPKGLVPFHKYSKFIINPFQEHILQGTKIAGDNTHFHFTINRSFESEIEKSIQVIKEISGIDFKYNFSEQITESHSYTFNDNDELIYEDNSPLRRPSGHGALIDNLNEIESDLIFIKNIDNVQHYQKATKSINTKKALGGLAIGFQNKAFNLLNAIESNSSNIETLASEMNLNYYLNLSPDQIVDKDFLYAYFNRPIRICGMVKNEGQPGGGPFWVSDENNQQSKQIIEKSQIASDNDQLSISLHSTHFNPVELICAVKTYKGDKFNLSDYVNNKQYFLVNKTHQGKNIKYIEQPGLWNGGMFNWLTLFYEIESECFSPVKTVLDLLNPLHLEK